jgi:hypothetical protein
MSEVGVKWAKDMGSHNQVAMTATAASIYDAVAAKQGIMIRNIGSNEVYIGNSSSVTFLLKANEVIILPSRQEIFGICDTGETSTVCYWEI